MIKIPFNKFDFEHSFHSISLKLDKMVGIMKNWSCTVFGPYQSKREGELGVTQIQEFLENESLATDFAETQQMNDTF